jgi:hypothetical protein
MINKTRLMGLAMECPFRKECIDCAFQNIRDLNDFEKQFEIIDNMTQEKIYELLKFHDSRRLLRERQNNQ